jgi:hypothetical protein
MDPTDSQPKATSVTINQIHSHAQCADAVCVKHRAQEQTPMPQTELPAGHDYGNPNCPICETITDSPLKGCNFDSCEGLMHRDQARNRMVCDTCNHHFSLGAA